MPSPRAWRYSSESRYASFLQTTAMTMLAWLRTGGSMVGPYIVYDQVFMWRKAPGRLLHPPDNRLARFKDLPSFELIGADGELCPSTSVDVHHSALLSRTHISIDAK
jgi:hypothetical protein